MARVDEPIRGAVITSGVYSLDSDTTTKRDEALEDHRDILASDAGPRGAEREQAEPALQLIKEQHDDTAVAVQHHHHQEAGCTSVSENLTASVNNSRGCWKFDSRMGNSRSLAPSNAEDEDECHPAPLADDIAEDVPSESHGYDDDSLNTSRSSQREERNSEDATVKLGANGGAVVVKSRDNSSASNSEATKTCSKCHVAKPTSLFYKDSGKPDGFYTICKLCKSKWQKAYKLAKRRREQRAAAALSQQQAAATAAAAAGGPPPCSTTTTTMMAAAEEQSKGGAAARLYSAMRSSGRHWDELLSYHSSATHHTAFYQQHGLSEDNVHRSASLAAGSSDAQRSNYSDRLGHHQDDCYLYLQAAAASQARMAEWARRMRSIPPPSRAAHYLSPFSSSHYPAAHYYDRPSPAGTDSAARGHHRLQRDGRQQPSREQGNIESSSNAVAAAPLLPLRHHFTDTRYDEAFDAHHGGGGTCSGGGSLHGREESSPQQDMRPQQRRSRAVEVLLRRHGSVSPTVAAAPTHSAAAADEQEVEHKVPSGLVHALDERMASNPSLERVKSPDCWHHQAPPSTEDGPSEEPPSTASRHGSIRQRHRHVVPCATADSDAVAGYHCGRSSGSAQAGVVGVKREADSPEAHSDDSPPTRQRSSMHCCDADECGGVADRQQRINGREQRRSENTSTADSSTQVVDERVLHMAMLVLRSNHSPHVQEMMLHDLSAAECVRLLQSSHLLPSESCDMLTRCILGQSPMYAAHRKARGKWPPTDDHTP